MSAAYIYVFMLELPYLDPLISEDCSCLSSWKEFKRKVYLSVYSLTLTIKILG